MEHLEWDMQGTELIRQGEIPRSNTVLQEGIGVATRLRSSAVQAGHSILGYTAVRPGH